MQLDQAINYVQQHGSPIEQARLAKLLHGTPVDPALTQLLFQGQQHDGGWSPFWANGYSSLDATCYRLAQSEALGLVPTAPETHDACRFLLVRQRTDGSWDETPPAGVTPPPWIELGTPEPVSYLTANCAFWLTQFPNTHLAIQQAAEFLQTLQTNAGHLPGALHSTWLALAVWHHLEAHTSFNQAQTYLSQHVDTLSASNLAWALTTFLLVKLPTTPLIQTMKQRLESLQRPDGAWSSDDGPTGNVHTTLEAIRILRG